VILERKQKKKKKTFPLYLWYTKSLKDKRMSKYKQMIQLVNITSKLYNQAQNG